MRPTGPVRPWALVAATAVPVLALLLTAGLGLAGVWAVGGYAPPEVAVVGLTPVPGALDRLGWVVGGLGTVPALTCAALGSTALAACRWAPGPWRVEGPVRRAALAVAASCAAAGVVAALAGLVVAFAPPTAYALASVGSSLAFVEPGDVAVAVAGPGHPFGAAAAVLVPAGVCAAAAAVLRGRRAT